jgi:predicted transposase YdaD
MLEWECKAMSGTRIREIVRRFSENGMKLMLENPKNARDLLLLTGSKMIDLIDWDHLTLVRTTFVERDYRQVESDVVLLAPLRQRIGDRSKRAIMIYILIEHQSEPDRLMPLRLLEYVVQIFKSQMRLWSQEHTSFAKLRLQPVLPVVFYTGTRRWEKVGRLVDLLERGEAFGSVTPLLDPLFVNLRGMQASRLESEGGSFGWVLRLLQERKAPLIDFRYLVERVIQHLETMPNEERLRWLELLSYIQALVYHERDLSEQQGLRETIEASVRVEEHRLEVSKMSRTIADALREEGLKKGLKKGRKEGEIRGLRQALLRQIRKRFGELSPEIVDTIEATQDINQLNTWLDQFVTARTLEQMKISPPT